MAPAAKAKDLYGDGRRRSFPDSWEIPPRSVLRNVFRRLPRNPEFEGVTFLCKPWLALPGDGPNVVAEPQRVMPGLLLPEQQVLDPGSRCFLSLADRRDHDITFPHARGARCVGSSHGWLVMLRKGPQGVAGAAGSDTVHIVHPLLPHLEFHLPDEFSLFEIQDAEDKEARRRDGLPYITEVTLSCSPVGSGDCVALCVYQHGRSLAIARPGDASWTHVKVGREYENKRDFLSVVYLKGSFYAACHDGTVLRVAVPPAGSAVALVKFADRPDRDMLAPRWWLADDAGALVFVGTEEDEYLCAFRWDEEGFWRRTKSFRGRALFLGAGTGTAFFADAQILPWCAGDCIYLTNTEDVGIGHAVTVSCYDMRSRMLYLVGGAGAKVAQAPPVWVMPFHA